MEKTDASISLLPDERIASKVLIVRGVKVILDRDLAELYDVETKILNQAVRRNSDRFPRDFMFQLSQKEFHNWKSQFVTSNPSAKMGLRKKPYAFTEQGVAMLSSVLRSKRAVQVNIQIIRTFTRLRQILASSAKIQAKIEKMDKQIQSIYKILGRLMTDEENPKRPIGFRVDNQENRREE